MKHANEVDPYTIQLNFNRFYEASQKLWLLGELVIIEKRASTAISIDSQEALKVLRNLFVFWYDAYLRYQRAFLKSFFKLGVSTSFKTPLCPSFNLELVCLGFISAAFLHHENSLDFPFSRGILHIIYDYDNALLGM